MSTLPSILALPAIATFLAVAACAPTSTPTGGATPGAAVAAAPVLLSCPVGQQPLLRQVVVGASLVPQVECVTAAGTPLAPAVAPVAAVPAGYVIPPAVPLTVPPAPVPIASAPEPRPAQVRTIARRPAARRVVFDDVEEIERPSRRSWQKSAVIIGSAAGVGAGVGAATAGKKGALIGAAVGGGAATLWDQVTRRQPR